MRHSQLFIKGLLLCVAVAACTQKEEPIKPDLPEEGEVIPEEEVTPEGEYIFNLASQDGEEDI